MTLAPEVQAAIIKVAGDWAVALASSPEYNPKTRSAIPIQPSQMSDELEKDFDFAYKFLTEYLK